MSPWLGLLSIPSGVEEQSPVHLRATAGTETGMLLSPHSWTAKTERGYMQPFCKLEQRDEKISSRLFVIEGSLYG